MWVLWSNSFFWQQLDNSHCENLWKRTPQELMVADKQNFTSHSLISSQQKTKWKQQTLFLPSSNAHKQNVQYSNCWDVQINILRGEELYSECPGYQQHQMAHESLLRLGIGLGPLGSSSQSAFHSSQTFIQIFSRFSTLCHQIVVTWQSKIWSIWELFPVPDMVQLGAGVPGLLKQLFPEVTCQEHQKCCSSYFLCKCLSLM